MKKLAIIGASSGQKMLYLKAKENNINVIGFAWENGAICKSLADKFYPISILEMDKIVEICKQEKIDGIISNGSDLTAKVVAYVSEKLHLIGNSYNQLLRILDKKYCRDQSKEVEGLSQIKYFEYDGFPPTFYPCVIKPETGNGKNGVCFVADEFQFSQAIQYAKQATDGIVVIEQYIPGREVSVECISYKGQHYVIQITDKMVLGAPHFVEIGHHQPSSVSECVKRKIYDIIPNLLNAVDFKNGATHIELKVNNQNEIFLIEINPRGGGGEISNQLTFLSTGFDYIQSMIDVALDSFAIPKQIKNISFAGIYFLCNQTKHLLTYFEGDSFEWLYEKVLYHPLDHLTDSTGNYNRDGFIIYKSDHKIEL